MKIICCQLDMLWENKKANCQKISNLLERTKVPPGSLVLLPEMFATGFSMNVAAIAEGKTAETEAFLAQTARERGVFVMGGVVNQDPDGRGRNEAVVYSPEGQELARYVKMQPFSLGGESKHYTAGTAVRTFRWQECVVAPFICYDLRFPEHFRTAVRAGTQLFAVIANWPVMREQHWVTLLQARAIENQAYVAGVNRTGKDPNLVYPGRSLIINPHGEIIADAGVEEGVVTAEMDLAVLREWRRDFPALHDMR